jgi:uncharacterized membrane protein
VAPSREDPLVRELSGFIGGPLGRRARTGERRFWLPVRVLAALAVLMAFLAWSEKSTCRVEAYAHEYQYTRLCYTDTFVLYGVEGLDAGKVPYFQHPVEYPVLIGAAMYAVADIDNHVFPEAARYREFFDLTAVLLALATVVTVVAVSRTSRGRPWDAAMLALAPAVLLNLDVNWDEIAVAFAACAMLAWSRKRPGWAGILLGLGVATKLYPLVLLIPIGALCWRAGRWRDYRRLLAGGVVSWLVVDLPVWIGAPSGFGYFYSFSEHRNTEFNSLWYSLDYALYGTSRLISTGRLNLVSGALFALGAAGVVFLALRAPQRPRVGQLCFLTVVAFVLTNKVYSPQYVLWVLPFAVMARPRWRLFLFWQLSEIVEFVTLYGYLIFLDTSGDKGVPYGFTFFLGILPRDLMLLTLAAAVVREIWDPRRDIVRAGGADDPAGGVLDEAEDAPRLFPRLGGTRAAPSN